VADKEREQELLAIIAELSATVAELTKQVAELQEALNAKKTPQRQSQQLPATLERRIQQAVTEEPARPQREEARRTERA